MSWYKIGMKIDVAAFGLLLVIVSFASSSTVLPDGTDSVSSKVTTTGDAEQKTVDAGDDNFDNVVLVDADAERGDDDFDDGVVVDADVHGMGDLDDDERLRLYQYDPVEVGHIRYVEISPGRFVQLKTLAVKPPTFEIPNFLSSKECERIKELALEKGLYSSATIPRNLSWSGIDETRFSYNATEWGLKLSECNNDTNVSLDFVEVLQCLPGVDDGEIIPPDILDRLYWDARLDIDSDGLINAKELWIIHAEHKTIEIKDWLSRWRSGELPEVTGRGRGRISQQAWITWWANADPTVTQIRERVTALTKLDRNIIDSSEDIQVVRYYPGGHYHAHWDSYSTDPDVPCDHTQRVLNPNDKNTRLCRYITILYYLHEVEGGGETAFPLADLDNITEKYMNNIGYDHVDLAHNCYKNLNVKPEYGKAVMWYSHFVDKDTGWMSDLDRYSLHGGCDVTKGMKWIANNWITVDDVYERQMTYHDKKLGPKKVEPTLESVETHNEGSSNEQDKEEQGMGEDDHQDGRGSGIKENVILTEEGSEKAPSFDRSKEEGLTKDEHSEL